MNEIAIVTDSTCDLPRELVAQRRISVVPLTVTLDGRSYQDGVDIDAPQFYLRLEAGGGAATTSQPSPGTFVETYEALLKEHPTVISLHISERLSGTLASAQQAARMVDAQRVHVIDSQVVSMPLGLLVLAAAELAGGEAPVEVVVQRLLELRSQLTTFFTVASLEYLRRGGRIGSASALLGSVLQVKPLLAIAEGQVSPVERVRTYDRAIARVIELARAVDRGHGICAIVGHAAREESAARIAEALEPVAETLLTQSLGPVVGAHAGPGTVGVACYPAELLPLGLKRVVAAASL
jgi:DegV family protein with EDD domain